ncbi:MAG: hypothetical protein QM485_05225 [Flavobacteriaceae bacterium]
MEPNKFEKHIGEQLLKREIQPSSTAWNRISDQLNTPIQSKRKGFFGYGIAASFIGVLFISIVFIGQKTKLGQSETKIVDTQEKKGSSSEKKRKPVIEKGYEKAVELDEANLPKLRIVDYSTLILRDKEKSQTSLTKKIELKPAVATSTVSSNKNILKIPEDIIKTKIAEIVLVADSLERNTSILTDAEVDSLLRKAQEEIVANKIYGDNYSVDAMALLNEVEDEIDQSFRDQIFETLKIGFLKVRTAVAESQQLIHQSFASLLIPPHLC